MYEPTPAAIAALKETGKEFIRWGISLAIGAILDGAVDFFTKQKLSPEVIAIITIVVRTLDYYWHRYGKAQPTSEAGVSYGLFRF